MTCDLGGGGTKTGSRAICPDPHEGQLKGEPVRSVAIRFNAWAGLYVAGRGLRMRPPRLKRITCGGRVVTPDRKVTVYLYKSKCCMDLQRCLVFSPQPACNDACHARSPSPTPRESAGIMRSHCDQEVNARRGESVVPHLRGGVPPKMGGAPWRSAPSVAASSVQLNPRLLSWSRTAFRHRR